MSRTTVTFDFLDLLELEIEGTLRISLNGTLFYNGAIVPPDVIAVPVTRSIGSVQLYPSRGQNVTYLFQLESTTAYWSANVLVPISSEPVPLADLIEVPQQPASNQLTTEQVGDRLSQSDAFADKIAARIGQRDIVSTFNGRKGVVVPQSGDYSTEQIAGLDGALDSKADVIDLIEGLATKANTVDLINGLATKASTTDLTTGLSVKSDRTEVALKADTTALNAGLATKANVGHTHSIADVDQLQQSLDTKATNTALTQGLATKENTGVAAILLSNHTNATDPHSQYATDSDLAAGLAGKSNVGHTHSIAQVSLLQEALDSKATPNDVSGAIVQHEQKANPHPQYATDSDLSSGLAAKENTGVAASLLSAHTGATDPHPQYATDSDLSSGLAGKENTGVAASLMSAHLASSDPHSQYATDSDLSTGLSGKENTGVAATLLSNHTNATDPHSQYATDGDLTSGLATKENTGVASSLLDAHTGATDPHPQYATDADLTTGLASKATSADISNAIANHVGATDPHSQYATDSDLAAHTSNTSNPHAVTASQLPDLAEAVDDRVALLLQPGSNISLNYDDTNNRLTINSTASGTLTSIGLQMPSIFNVANSPLTANGSFNVTLSSQSQNLVWASPNGAAGSPTFRSLVAADIPNLSSIYQPLDSDLTSIAALTTTTFGRSLLTQTDAPTTRSTIGAFNVAGDIITGTAGTGFIGLPIQSSNPSAATSGFRLFANSAGSFSWIGASGFVRSFAGSITADRAYTLPDSTGTIALTSDLAGYFPNTGGTLTGTAGTGFIGLPPQSSTPATPTSSIRLFTSSTGILSWINSSGFVRSLGGVVTADRVYTFPDASGTVALLNTLTEVTSYTITGAANTIPVSSTGSAQVINLTLSASVTLTSTPNVQKTSVPTGKKVTLVNTSSSFHLVLINLGAAGTEEAIVPPSKTIDLVYNGTQWLITSRTDSGLAFRGYTTASFTINSTFTTCPIGVVDVDLYGKFSSNTWTVPASGYYRCDSKLRINDARGAWDSYGQGVHTSNVDGAWFQWFVTVGTGTFARNGSLNSRTAFFNRGDVLRMYAYSDIAMTTIGSPNGQPLELLITKL